MDPKYDHTKTEAKIYQMWESGGYFTPKIDPTKKPFTIVLPPPNASGKMHIGNVLMIAIEDLLIRWHRMMGDPTLWIPGTDHAGIETQTTFERELKKQDKSRFDFDRQTLYQMIWDFVQGNKGQIEKQIREMGASVDWTRLKFTLDPDVVSTVYRTFEKMHNDGLVYRGDYLVNYSFKWGTTFSDAEIHYVEKVNPLYYIRYPLKDDPSKLVEVATVRPELIMVDTHLAVNPKSKQHAHLIGKHVLNPLTQKPMMIFADNFVDPKFGTGIVKLTPAHDKTDYQIAVTRKDLNIPIVNAIDVNGKLNENTTSEFQGLTIKAAREKALEVLSLKGLLNSEKTNANYTHQVPVDIRSDDYIENLILPNWFVKIESDKVSLKKFAIDAVKKDHLTIFPKWRQVTYTQWVENLRDWTISRQNIWGIRIPVWYEVTKESNIFVYWISDGKTLNQNTLQHFLSQGVPLENIKAGLQRVYVATGSTEPKWIISATEPQVSSPEVLGYIQETDTFDTWFSSGQWPLVTLGYPDSENYKYFYPTSVLETGWEIITRWVSRMVMLGYYLGGELPFKDVYLHGHVRAIDGRKMSKSLGNMINPDEYQKEFGTDALRMGLISGTANGHDFNFPRDKVIAYRNFGNKLWNIGRFLQMNFENKVIDVYSPLNKRLTKEDKELIRQLRAVIKKVNSNIGKFRFAQAGEVIYQFVWHEFADKYIESSKDRIKGGDIIVLTVLNHVYLTSLKLLHPFMPFITEDLWQIFSSYRDSNEPLIVSSWPTSK